MNKIKEITKLLTLFLSFSLILSFLISDPSYAWFVNRYVSPYEPEIEGADFTLDVNFTGPGSTVNLSDGLPTSDTVGLTYDGYTFTIENIGNVPIKTYIKVDVDEESAPYSTDPSISMFRSREIRDALILKDYYYQDPDDPYNVSGTPSFDRWIPNQLCTIDTVTYDCVVGAYKDPIYTIDLIPGEIYEFEMKFWIAYATKTVTDKLFYGQIIIETAQTDSLIITNTEANDPELKDGMIPVVWDENSSTWVVIQSWDAGWFNYSDEDILDSSENVVAQARQWANVVTVTSAQVSNYLSCDEITGCSVIPAMVGESISESIITNMFVWIPRFRYAVRSTVANGSESNIDVVWENGTSTKFDGTGIYYGRAVTNFYTASAFTQVETELPGFWISKFELGTSSSGVLSSYANLSMDETINEDSWNDEITTDYITNGASNYGIDLSDETIMQIKNSQWDAIAFLSQSRYGKFGDDGKAVLPNNYFSSEIISSNTTYQYYEAHGSNTTKWYTTTNTVSSATAGVKSGYACAYLTLSNCLTYTYDNTTSSTVTAHTYRQNGVNTYATHETVNTSDQSLTTSSVYYTDATYGGHASTTGNIYGVYDMSMGRDELTSTYYVQVGYNHSAISGLEDMLTFAIPDATYTTVYISEYGVGYNASGNVVYNTFFDVPGTGYNEYIIEDDYGFSLDSYAYFQNRFTKYTYDSTDYIIEKGSSNYLLDSSKTGYSLFNARLDWEGVNYAYVSRGGNIGGSYSVVYNITYTGDAIHTVSFTDSGSMSPYITESGIFAWFSTRSSSVPYSATTNFINSGDYTVNTNVSATGEIDINSTSRVVILG